jgi:large-conductance mechanosensitive channel
MSALSVVTESAGRYVHWGVFLISVTNLLVVVAMVFLFVLALVVPFPSRHGSQSDEEGQSR